MTAVTAIAVGPLSSAARAAFRRLVLAGECPKCGAPLQSNPSLPGWFQCVASVAPGRRAPAHRALPACAFQVILGS